MNMKKGLLRRVICLTLVAVMLLGVAACSGNNTKNGATDSNTGSQTSSGDGNGSGDSTKTGRTDLNLLIRDGFITLDPHNWNLDTDYKMCYQIYEPLVAFDDTRNETLILATAYEVSEDGLSYIFNILDDVYFTNGEKLNASDVKFSIERAKVSSYLSSNIPTVDTVDADDEAMTVTVNLSAPTPGLLEGLSFILITNQKFVEENADSNGMLGFATCGTGPYMLKEYTADVSVTMEANPDYRYGEASIKSLKYTVITDENTAATAFQAGELDILSTTSSVWPTLKANAGDNWAETPLNHITYLVINTEQAPFDNVLLRQAIACAVNREDIIAMALEGMAQATDSLVTSYMVGYPETTSGFIYDPERARKLLTEAGYPDGIEIGELLVLGGTYFEAVGEVLQQQLAEVGINCSLVAGESSTVISNMMGGNFGVGIMGQTNTGDMSWLSTYYDTSSIDSLNMARYSNSQIDAKLAEAGVCMDPEQRTELYGEIITELDKECVYVPFFNRTLCEVWAEGLNYSSQIRVYRYYDARWN